MGKERPVCEERGKQDPMSFRKLPQHIKHFLVTCFGDGFLQQFDRLASATAGVKDSFAGIRIQIRPGDESRPS